MSKGRRVWLKTHGLYVRFNTDISTANVLLLEQMIAYSERHVHDS